MKEYVSIVLSPRLRTLLWLPWETDTAATQSAKQKTRNSQLTEFMKAGAPRTTPGVAPGTLPNPCPRPLPKDNDYRDFEPSSLVSLLKMHL